MKRTPPLNSLKAFEAAARHGSFARAAIELNVTPAAISHQVKELEQTLGLMLFTRQARGVALSAAGESYRASIAEALTLISRATASLQTDRLQGPLRLTLPHSFAQSWLTPRLASLISLHPDLQLCISADNQLADIHAQEADIAIRFGNGDYPGLHAEFLLADAATILIATDQLERTMPSSNVNLLADALLLEDVSVGRDEPWMSWQPWLREAGVDRDPSRKRIRFSNGAMAIDACLSGTGLCIARLSLVLDALRRRQATALLPWRSTEFAYYIVYREGDADNPRLRAFIDWLRHEGGSFAALAQATSGHEIRSATMSVDLEP